MSRWRGRARRAAAGVGVAFLVLLLVEGGTRLLFGAPHPRLQRALYDVDREAYRVENGAVTPIFQGRDAIDAFARAPRQGRPRVLVFGGSSVRGGSHLAPAREFPAVAAEQLASQGRKLEILNLGRPALDSHHLRVLVQQSAFLKPDVVVIYTGHNDLGNITFQERYGELDATLLVRARFGLRRLRSYELLMRLVPAPLPGPPGALSAVSPARRAAAVADFRDNLDAIVQAAQEAGASVVLVTPISNAAGAGPAVPTCPEAVPPGAASLQGGAYRLHAQRTDLAAVDRALAQAPDCPELLFLKGLVLGPGTPEAAPWFVAAREQDPLPTRATTAIVQTVREVAVRRDTALVDLVEQATSQPGGAPPAAWFVDAVHLSATGHRVVGDAVAEGIEAALGR